MTMLEMAGVSTGYGPSNVLHEVNLVVKTGEIVALIGSNGAGKTTLLMTLYGYPRARAGAITFEGQNITQEPTHRIAPYGIALVPEGRRVFSAMTVLENLKMGAVLTGGEPPTADLEHVFKLFPRLKEREHQRAGTLSGGEQQMLAIGRAMMARPRLLLLDEPSLGLAPLIVKQIFETIKIIAKEGTTIFLVEQNANHALRLADHGYVLVNGRITLAGTGRELLTDPEIKKAYLGGS